MDRKLVSPRKQKQKISYRCPGCLESFDKWSNCLSHIRNTQHTTRPYLNVLVKTKLGRRELQEYCKFKGVGDIHSSQRELFLSSLPLLEDSEWERVLSSLF